MEWTIFSLKTERCNARIITHSTKSTLSIAVGTMEGFYILALLLSHLLPKESHLIHAPRSGIHTEVKSVVLRSGEITEGRVSFWVAHSAPGAVKSIACT